MRITKKDIRQVVIALVLVVLLFIITGLMPAEASAEKLMDGELDSEYWQGQAELHQTDPEPTVRESNTSKPAKPEKPATTPNYRPIDEPVPVYCIPDTDMDGDGDDDFCTKG